MGSLSTVVYTCMQSNITHLNYTTKIHDAQMRFSPFRFSLCIFPEIFFIFVQFSENDPKRLTPQAYACYTTSTLQHFSPIRREFYEISIIIPADFSRHFHDTVNHCRASFRPCCHPDRFCRPYFHCTDAVSGVPVCRSGVLSWCRCLKRQTAIFQELEYKSRIGQPLRSCHREARRKLPHHSKGGWK